MFYRIVGWFFLCNRTEILLGKKLGSHFFCLFKQHNNVGKVQSCDVTVGDFVLSQTLIFKQLQNTHKVIVTQETRKQHYVVIQSALIQGGSNMTGTDLCVNKPHCVPVIFEPPCTYVIYFCQIYLRVCTKIHSNFKNIVVKSFTETYLPFSYFATSKYCFIYTLNTHNYLNRQLCYIFNSTHKINPATDTFHSSQCF